MKAKANRSKRKWLIWSAICFAYIFVIFHRIVMGVIKGDITGDFYMSSITYANLSAAFFYVYMIMQIPTGMLVDSLGVRTTATVATVLTGLGSVLFGLAYNIPMLFAARLMIGLGASVIFISLLKLQANWFDDRAFATLSGLTSFLGSMGALLSQTPLVFAVALFTWRYTFVAIGIISILNAGVIFLIVRNHPADILEHQSEHQVVEAQKTDIFKALKSVLTNPYTYPPVIIYAAFSGVDQAFMGTWGQSYFMGVYHMSKYAISNYFSIMIISGAVGSFAFAGFSDRIGRRKGILLTAGAVYFLAWFYLVVLAKGKPPEGSIGFLSFIIGLCPSATVLTWACVKEVNDSRYVGISTSVANTFGFLAAAVVPLLVGAVIDKYSTIYSSMKLYSTAFIICLIFAALGVLAMLPAKETGR